jgi:predicted regulator of Ras-like GTPase activity (Roadblock/LC7/MglB family)
MHGSSGRMGWDGAMSEAYAGLLDRLARARGVRGSLIVSQRDGLVIDANLRIGQRGDSLAAFAATVYRKTRLGADAARLGATTFLQLDAERGHVCAAGREDLLIVVVTEPGANIGLIRVELLRAVEFLQ